jgi:hypothetical protein
VTALKALLLAVCSELTAGILQIAPKTIVLEAFWQAETQNWTDIDLSSQ